MSKISNIKITLLGLLLPFAISTQARADVESWNWIEYRLPIVGENQNFPKTSLRVFTDARLNARSNGLDNLFLRVGPLVDVTPWMFVGFHGTLLADRLANGDFEQEVRAEIEPNIYGRFGDFTYNDRNRLEYRMRPTSGKFRYRNQLRVNYAPKDAKIIPYIWDEVLIDLAGEYFNQNRATIGFGIVFNENTRLDLGYILRTRYENQKWENDHIALVSLFVDIPKQK